MPLAAFWRQLQRWKELAPKIGIEIIIGPSPREKEIQEYRHHLTGINDAIPERHRTILEVKNKLIYIDCQDYPTIGANLHKVPDLFDLCIKYQYREGYYDNIPFKVVPFVYYSPQDYHQLMKYREIRKQILKEKGFKYSVMCAGATHGTGLQTRKTILHYLLENTQRSKYGRFQLENYFQYICQSAILASAHGNGDFCHRDIECMAIGTPFFRKTFKNKMHDPLMPNVHYYTIGGDELGIWKILQHFCNYFEPNGELIQFSDKGWEHYRMIVDHGMQWYDQNASPEGSLKLLLHILEENGI